VLTFAGVFAALEWIRGHILTGFPWNLPGETWRAGSLPSQAAALVGAYGLTWITLAIAAAPAVWREGKSGRIALGAAFAGLIALYGYGAIVQSRPLENGPPVSVRLVQADIQQDAKWDAVRFSQIVQSYVSLTAKPYAGKPADLVIWPEGALPAAVNDYLAPGTWVRQAILDAVQPGQTLLIGGYRYEGPVEKPVYYNSLIALRRTATDLEVVGVYDKHRLVPFGEYLPAEAFLTRIGFKSLAHLGRRFRHGPAPGAAPGCARPAGPAADLLREPLPRLGQARSERPGSDQCLERRLVRRHLRAVAAPEPGQLPRNRERQADLARDADRSQCGDRRARPNRPRNPP
jgi:apolipoprotein N-acyltransferase